MPYKSQAQRALFHVHPPKGVNVKEWDRASKGLKLPKRASKRHGKRRK